MNRLTVALVLLLILASPRAAAPFQVADAVLEISVVDDSGAALPEVTITVMQPETGLQRTALSDALGLSRTIGLPPGIYDVRLERSGFKTAIEKSLSLRVGQISRTSVRMGVAPQAETLTVVAQPVLMDVFKTDSSTNIVPAQIESLPVPDRDFQRLAFLTPGVQRERGGNRFIGNGPLIGAAGNASQTTIMVDGVDFTDPMAGLSRVRFTQEAIAEFRVIANRFDAEIGGSSAGALSIITKSGDNEVKGSVYGFVRHNSLRAKSALELQKNDYSRTHFGLTLFRIIRG
jgi:hypothetical protein